MSVCVVFAPMLGNLTADSSSWLFDKSITFTFYRSIADPQDRVPVCVYWTVQPVMKGILFLTGCFQQVLEYEFRWKLREPCSEEETRLEPVIREAKEWQVVVVPATDVYQMNYDVREIIHSCQSVLAVIDLTVRF